MEGSSEITNLAWVGCKAMVIVPEVVPDNLYKQYTEFSTLPIFQQRFGF